MTEWVDDEFCINEEEFVDVKNDLSSSDDLNHQDARRRLEMLLEEKQLREDLDDYY